MWVCVGLLLSVVFGSIREKPDDSANVIRCLLVAQVADKQLRELDDEERKLKGLAKLNVPRATIPAVTHVDNSARIKAIQTRLRKGSSTMAKRQNLVSELIAFLKHNKAYWMVPIIVVLLLLAALVVFGGSSAAPFIYTLF